MADTKKTQSKLGSKFGIGCGFLFLLPFAAVGVAMTFWTLWCVYDYTRMQGWDEVPATITRLEQTGGDGTTGIEAEFEYEYAGQHYTGDRAAIHSGNDNIGRFQRRLYAELKHARDRERTVPCYVNPSVPDEAILNRELRPGMIMFKSMFGLIFGGVGIGGWIGMWLSSRTQAKQNVNKEQHADEPWLCRDDWRDGVIKSDAGMAVIGLSVFTAIWNSISWPVFLMVAFDGKDQEWFALPLVSLFPIIGSIMLIFVFVAIARWLRFRGNYLRMASTPGVIGGTLSGVVVIPRPLAPDDGFHVRLKCVQTVGSGEDSKQVTLFESERLINRTLDSGDPRETNVPVMFTVPSSATATDDESDIKWTVECDAKLPGPDLDLEYEVPVFRTPDSRDDVSVDDQLTTIADYEVRESLEESLAREGIRMERGVHPDEVVFRTPPVRHLGVCLGMLAFAVIWTVICVALWWGGAWFFAAFFTLFDLLVVPGALSVWLSTRELTIRRDRWRLRSGWWPLLWSSREFESSDIRGFSLESNMTTGEKKWNQLKVKLRGKKRPVVLSHGLGNRRVEQLWIADLRERAGLDDDGGDDERDDEGLVLDREIDG